jgi:outer membrane lipoprotein SlyB
MLPSLTPRPSMKSPIPQLAVILALVPLLSGCAEVGVPRYTPSEVGVTLNSERVKITNVRKVLIHDGEPGAGTLAGGIAGGVAGSMIGSGKASALGAVGGALGGLFLGNQADKHIGASKALEISFVRTNGRESVLVQPDNGEVFLPGQEARWISNRSSSRITH